MKNIITLLLIIFLFSCQEKKQAETKTPLDAKLPSIRTVVKIGADDQTDSTLIVQTKNEILNRFKDLGFNVTVEKGNEAQSYIFQMKIDTSDYEVLAKFRAAFGSTDFGMWDTYRVDDPEIESIINSIPEMPSFTLNKNGNFFQKEILGASTDLSDHTKTELEQFFQKNKNVKLLWGRYPFGNGGRDGLPIYLIKMDASQKPTISSEHMKKAVAKVGQLRRPEIYVEMTEAGAEAWYQMTKRAFDSGQRCIAIVINDEVYSVPRVSNGAISGGKSSIVGEFNLEEAAALATGLKNGALPYKAVIYEEKMIDYEEVGKE